jgi:hypothetical protein
MDMAAWRFGYVTSETALTFKRLTLPVTSAQNPGGLAVPSRLMALTNGEMFIKLPNKTTLLL